MFTKQQYQIFNIDLLPVPPGWLALLLKFKELLTLPQSIGAGHDDLCLR